MPNPSVRAVLVAAALSASGPAFAQEVPQDFPQDMAPRCPTPELAVSGTGEAICERPVAVLGLTGPTVLTADSGLDVTTTGSIGPADGAAARETGARR